MMSAAQLSNIARLLLENAKAARHVAHYDEPNAAEIHWLAHQIEDIANTLQKLNRIGRTSGRRQAAEIE